MAGQLTPSARRAGLPSISRQTRPDVIPLSTAQSIWLPVERVPVQEQWLVILWRLRGRINPAALVRSYKALLARHESLRTHYFPHGDGYRQEVMPEASISLNALDTTDSPADVREMEIWERLRPMCVGYTPLEAGPVRIELFKVDEYDHLLGGFIHHIATDGLSQQIFNGQLMEGYFNDLLGKPMPAPPQFQYADFALWEKQWLTTEARAQADSYWASALADAEPMAIPGGRSFGDPPSARSIEYFSIPHSLFKDAVRFAPSVGVTMNILFQTALATVLARWSGQDRAVIGNLCQCRPVGFEDTIGCFMQLRPFFLKFNDDPTVTALLARARGAAAAASDIRRPISPSVIARLNIGNVLLNYVRQNTRSPLQIIKPGAHGEPPSPQKWGGRKTRAGVAASPSPRSAMLMKNGALNMTRPGGALSVPPRGLHAASSHLPKRLQTEGSRDLHIGVTQGENSFIGRITYDQRYPKERILMLIDDLTTQMRNFITAPDRRLSDLASQPPVVEQDQPADLDQIANLDA